MQKDRIVKFVGVPRPSKVWILGALLLSLLLHLFSYVNVSYFAESVKGNRRKSPSRKLQEKVTIKVRSQQPKKKLLEAKQTETEAPKNSRFQSHNNHIAEKETKTNRLPQSINDLDAGEGGQQKSQQQQKVSPQPFKKPKIPKFGIGSGPYHLDSRESRYQALLPRTEDLVASRQAGYQDYIEDEIEVADRIDLNTSEYRYMFYFVGLRKGWSQTWVYPSEAVRRGLQGKVKIEFTILKDGDLQAVKVLETSGHTILDDAVLEAVTLSSPYAPLPDGFGKDKITIEYSFIYRLSGQGA